MSEISVIEHIHSMQHRWSPQATGQFTSLMHDLVLSAKIISRSVAKAGLVDILGGTGDVNIQGEAVQKLDEFANDVMIYRMIKSGAICALGSEEAEDPIFVPKETAGNYIIFFDPLDGSSNIDVNVSIGTIFSIYRVTEGEYFNQDDLLRRGSEQVAAGYFLYGPSTMMVYSTGHGVHAFTLDPSVGEFLLSHPDLTIPDAGKYYSANLGNYSKWNDNDKKAMDIFNNDDNYSLRYVGSLVADFHRTLIYGGLFAYPADNKNKDGKLRLVYEAAPLAFLIEQAGGQAFDGDGMRILDKAPKHLHARTAFLFGSKAEVAKYRAAFK